MEIWDILRQERNILSQLKEIVIHEKEVLINNDSRALSVLVEKKIYLVNELEKIEKSRLSIFGNKKVSEMEIPDKYIDETDNLRSEIKTLHAEVKAYQEINMVLTHQTIDYHNNMMEIIQQAVARSGSVYGDNGKISNSKVKSFVDQSV